MYDVVVIGLGSMGSSALYHLAKAGVNVLGIEQFGITHKYGSHSGSTRIVRKAYFEHPDYVPLLKRAYKGWDELEDEIGLKLFHKTGLAYLGESDHPVMRGIKESARLYDVELQANSNALFDQFTLEPNFEKLIEPDAGFALTESTIRSLIQLAEGYGAQTKINEQVSSIIEHSDHIIVSTSNGEYKTRKLILTAGAYIGSLINSPKLELKVTRQLLFWVKPENSSPFQIGNFPSWMIADNDFPGVFYGFPIIPENQPGGNGLLKVAHHTSGEIIEPEKLHEFNPEEEKGRIELILKKYIPQAIGEIKSVSACLYTNSVDDDFIIDFAPNSNENVILATGFSGHGFKFVPIIGEVLKDLALEGKTDHPIEFLKLDRFK